MLSQEVIYQPSKESYTKANQVFDSLWKSKKRKYEFWEESSLQLFTEAKVWAENSGTEEEYLHAQFMLLIYYDNQLKDDEVIKIAEEMIQNPWLLETNKSLYTYQSLYDSYERRGFYRRQIEIVNILNELNANFNYEIRPEAYDEAFDLAKIYYNLGQYDLAITYFKKQYKTLDEAGNFFRASSMINNVGLSFEKKNDRDSARVYYELAHKKLLSQKRTDPYLGIAYNKHFKNVILANIANLDLQEGIYNQVEERFKAELNSSISVKEPRVTLSAYTKLTNYYLQIKEFALAQQYLDSAQQFQKKYPNKKIQVEHVYLNYQLSKGQNQEAEAENYLAYYLSLLKDMSNAKANDAYLEATAKFNYDEAQRNLEKNKMMLKQKDKINTILVIFVISFSISLILILWLLRKTKKSNLLITFQKEELAKGLEEKQLLLDEMHHRTKNNLQIVSGILEIQSQKNISKKAHSLLKESQNYLESISLIHKLLYEQEGFETIDAHQYFEKLISLVVNNYPKLSIVSKLDVASIPLHINTATSLGLIISELLINSIKHAFPKEGIVWLQLTKNANLLELKYRDNGTFNATDEMYMYKGKGMMLIHSLAKDVHGKIVITSQNGFCFQLKFTDNGI